MSRRYPCQGKKVVLRRHAEKNRGTAKQMTDWGFLSYFISDSRSRYNSFLLWKTTKNENSSRSNKPDNSTSNVLSSLEQNDQHKDGLKTRKIYKIAGRSLFQRVFLRKIRRRTKDSWERKKFVWQKFHWFIHWRVDVYFFGIRKTL
jgi:hypothetical protein